MLMKRNTEIGYVNVTASAIASLTGALVTECYGVVGMASKHLLKDNMAVLLRQDNYSKGVIVSHDETGLVLDIYVVICYGVRISQVVTEVQKKVKYELENAFDIDVSKVNVFVQGVKVIE